MTSIRSASVPRVIAALCVSAATSAAQPAATRTREVPSQYASIQAAIDSARPGDSVVVAPGRYRESVRFGGKSIVLASRFARTRDPNDILATIIDGSRPAHPDSGSTVLIVDREDSTTVLEGFTILGGTGTVWHDAAGRNEFQEGGGVLCELSSPTIRYNRILGGHAIAPRNGRIRSSGGGGIRCGYSEPTIEGNFIAGNRGRYGAGLVLFHSAGIVRNNVFAANSGGEDFGGAGAWVVNNLSRRLTTEFVNNTIVNNAVVGSDSGTARTMTGKGGGALFSRVNIHATGNALWGNAQPSKGQLALGPGLQGSVDGNDEKTDLPGRRVGSFGLLESSLSDGAFSGRESPRIGSILRALVVSNDMEAAQVAGVDLAARRRELMAADSALGSARGVGLAARLTAPLAPDAFVFGPRTTLWRGVAEARAALEADTANARAEVAWAPIRGDVSADGTEGFTFGFLDLKGGSSPRKTWKYLAYWKRDASGKWAIVAHKRLPREAGSHETSPPAGFATPVSRKGSWFPSGPAAVRFLASWDSAFAKVAQTSPVKAFTQYTAATGATLSGSANFAWGPEKVAAEFAQFEPGAIDWGPDFVFVAPSGDLGWATGEVIIRQKGTDGKFVESARGRYFTIWQRMADGTWKLIIDG